MPINSLLISETIKTNAKVIANQFNSFFAGVAAKPNEKFMKATIPDKIFGSKRSNPVILDRKKKVWYLFFACFLTAIGKI